MRSPQSAPYSAEHLHSLPKHVRLQSFFSIHATQYTLTDSIALSHVLHYIIPKANSRPEQTSVSLLGKYICVMVRAVIRRGALRRYTEEVGLLSL